MTALTGITSVATTGIFTKTTHGLVAGQAVVPAANVLDSFLTVGTVYYVTATNLAANTFSLGKASAPTTVLTGTTNDTNLTLNLMVLTVATRGSVNGFAAAAHADKTPVFASKVKHVIHIGDSTVQGVDSSSPSQASDSWSSRAGRTLADRMGGQVAKSWPQWSNTNIDVADGVYTFNGTALPVGVNNYYDVGWEGAFVFSSGTANNLVWTRPPGERVQAVDIFWVDWDATGAQWSYSLDGGSTWVDNPVASIYASGIAPLRRTRIACNDPTDIRVRAATAAGTAKTIVMSNVPLTTWTVYPYAGITEGVHWANLGHLTVKLRTTLSTRSVADGVANGTTTVSSATAAFVSADANSAIYVNGVAYTISSVTDSTHVVLSGTVSTATGVRLSIMQGSGTGDWMAQFLGHHGAWFPDLVIIGPYTNDMAAFTTTGTDGDFNMYGDMLQFLYDKIHPVADILFVAPHERSDVTAGAQTTYRATMHTIAAANNAAIFDIYDAFSAYGYTGYTAVNTAGYMADVVHFSQLGHNWVGAQFARGMAML